MPESKDIKKTGSDTAGPYISNDMDVAGMYTEIRSSLMRFAFRYFKHPQEIEDVVQEAFVKIVEAKHRTDIQHPKSYMFRTVRNLALKQLHKSDYRLTDTVGDFLPETVLHETPTLEHQFESRQRFELFCRAVRQLPVKCQKVYILRKVYGFSQREIAERMGISLKTVEAHLTKAIVRCTEYMEEASADNDNQQTVQNFRGIRR